MNIAVITGASSDLGVKFLKAVLKGYPYLDEYWINQPLQTARFQIL